MSRVADAIRRTPAPLPRSRATTPGPAWRRPTGGPHHPAVPLAAPRHRRDGPGL